MIKIIDNQNVYMINKLYIMALHVRGCFFIYSDLDPGLDYLIYVIAENGITDQVPDRLQSLGTSVTVTTETGIQVCTKVSSPGPGTHNNTTH